MSSNLACVGLAVADRSEMADLIRTVLPRTTSLGRAGPVDVLRYQDPGGARLVLHTLDNQIRGYLPSFAGSPGARLDDMIQLSEDVWKAAVVDRDGSQLTATTLELEQGWILSGHRDTSDVSIVALGGDVAVFADEAAFAASPASLLGDPADAGEPPPHVVEKGWPWPPRMAAESFFSYGVFSSPDEADARARLNGVVLRSERRTTAITGQEFHVARVSTIGIEVDVCLAATDHPDVPAPGQVIGGTVFLVGSLEPWIAPPEGEPTTGLARLKQAFGRRN